MTVAYNVNGSVQVCPGCLSEHFEECRGCGEFYEICMLEDGLCPDCAATTPTSEGEVEDGGNNEGYLVYCFDFRGGSDSSRSKGSNLEMSVFTEQSDLEAVIVFCVFCVFCAKKALTRGGGAVIIHSDGSRGTSS